MDDYAIESHRRAEAARAAGVQRDPPVAGVDSGDTGDHARDDEGIRAVIDVERMRAMQPVFRQPGEGGVTAANASQMSDGAAAVMVGRRAAAEALRHPAAPLLPRPASQSAPTRCCSSPG